MMSFGSVTAISREEGKRLSSDSHEDSAASSESFGKRKVSRRLPKEKHNQLDLYETQRWIAAHPEKMRESVRELSERVEHIPFSTFNANFQEGVKSFNSALKSESVEDYLVMVEPGKSNSWMFEDLALPSLIRPPKDIAPLGKKGTRYVEFLQAQRAADKPFFPETVVFFDDGIYSGKQMSNFVKGVFDGSKAFNEAMRKKREDEIPIPQIDIICPYATDFGKKKIYSVNAEHADQIFMSPQQRIKTLDEVMSSAAVGSLEPTLWHLDPRGTDGSFATEYLQGMHSRGNIWFDHKVPNWMSFVFPLEAGVVTGEDGAPLNGKLGLNEADEPVFTPFDGQKITPIPETVPPYKA